MIVFLNLGMGDRFSFVSNFENDQCLQSPIHTQIVQKLFLTCDRVRVFGLLVFRSTRLLSLVFFCTSCS